MNNRQPQRLRARHASPELVASVRLLGLVVVIAALVLASCTRSTEVAQTSSTTARPGTTAELGGDLGSVVDDVQEVLEQSARQARQNRSGRMVVELRVEGNGDIDGLWLSVDGAFDLDQERTEVVIVPSSVAKQAGLTESTTVAEGSDVYVNDPVVAVFLDVDTTWMGYSDPCGASGAGQGLIPFGGADAAVVLEAAAEAGEALSEVAEERIGGVEATHYRAAIDLGEVVETMAPGCRSEFEEFFGSEVPVDVWIHSESGVVMREQFTFELAEFVQRTGGADPDEVEDLPGELIYLVDFYDQGNEIEIDVPPADEVTEVSKDDYDAAIDEIE